MNYMNNYIVKQRFINMCCSLSLFSLCINWYGTLLPKK